MSNNRLKHSPDSKNIHSKLCEKHFLKTEIYQIIQKNLQKLVVLDLLR